MTFLVQFRKKTKQLEIFKDYILHSKLFDYLNMNDGTSLFFFLRKFNSHRVKRKGRLGGPPCCYIVPTFSKLDEKTSLSYHFPVQYPLVLCIV